MHSSTLGPNEFGLIIIDLLKAPIQIKEIIYKHYDKSNEFLIQWFDYHIKKSKGQQSKMYNQYKTIISNLIFSCNQKKEREECL